MTSYKQDISDIYMGSSKELLEWKRSVEDLYSNYPRVFRYKVISVDTGWHGILHEVGQAVEALIDKAIKEHNLNPIDAPYIISMKEKYGTLRIDFDYMPDYLFDDLSLIEQWAEDRSSKICEKCGKKAIDQHIKSGWILTRCEEHI